MSDSHANAFRSLSTLQADTSGRRQSRFCGFAARVPFESRQGEVRRLRVAQSPIASRNRVGPRFYELKPKRTRQPSVQTSATGASTAHDGWRGTTPAGRADRRPGWMLGRWASVARGAGGLSMAQSPTARVPTCESRSLRDTASSHRPIPEPRAAPTCTRTGVRKPGTTNGRPRDRHAVRWQTQTGLDHDRRISRAQPVGDGAATVSRRTTVHPSGYPSASDVTHEPDGMRQT